VQMTTGTEGCQSALSAVSLIELSFSLLASVTRREFFCATDASFLPVADTTNESPL
jgi:hypothetical protein